MPPNIGNRIRIAGNEFGTVTGRPRRCGWFDAVATRYSARISGIDTITVALLDVLTGFDELYVCEAYNIRGTITKNLPSRCEDLAVAQPVLRRVPGWTEDITGITRFEKLPTNAQLYCHTVQELIGRPIEFVSVGPDRSQTIRIG